MRFFVDNCLAPGIARCLHHLSTGDGHQVVHLQDRFPPAIKDTDWIGQLAAEGDWIIVSGDKAILRKPQEQEAWHRSGLTAFFLAKGWMNLGFYDQAAKIVRWWPKIIDQAALVAEGSGFLVPVKVGRFRQLAR